MPHHSVLFKIIQDTPEAHSYFHVDTSTALNCICRTVQQQVFYREYQALVKNKIVHASSDLIAISVLR